MSNVIPIRGLDRETYLKFKSRVKKEKKNVGSALNEVITEYLAKDVQISRGDKNRFKIKYQQAPSLKEKVRVISDFILELKQWHLAERSDIRELMENMYRYPTTKEQTLKVKREHEELIKGGDGCSDFISKTFIEINDIKDFEERFENNSDVIIWFISSEQEPKIAVGGVKDFSARVIEEVIHQYNLFCELTDRSSDTYKKFIDTWTKRRWKLVERAGYFNKLCDEIAKELFGL